MSILDFIGAKDDGSDVNNWRHAKLQSNQHHQQNNSQLFYNHSFRPVDDTGHACYFCIHVMFIRFSYRMNLSLSILTAIFQVNLG